MESGLIQPQLACVSTYIHGLILNHWNKIVVSLTSLLVAVDCQRPPLEDVNGDVQFDETTLGNEATYTCDAGFELESGEATFVIQCLASGQWSDAAPTCNRE